MPRRCPHGDSSPWPLLGPRSRVRLSTRTPATAPPEHDRSTGAQRGRASQGEGNPAVNAIKGMNVEKDRRMEGQLRAEDEEIKRIVQMRNSGTDVVTWTCPDDTT